MSLIVKCYLIKIQFDIYFSDLYFFPNPENMITLEIQIQMHF